MKPGRSLTAAQAEMTALSAGLREAHPATNEGRGLTVTALRGVHPAARASTVRLATLLLGGVTLVLAVACANLSSLLLARSLTRRREIAIRLALGATRGNLILQFVAEAVALALLGGAAGVLLASWFGRVIVVLYPSDVPLELGIDLRVLGYAVLLSVVTGLVVGLVPGLQSTRPDLVPVIKEEAMPAGLSRSRWLGSLIVVQVALSFVLLSSTGLLARSIAGASRAGGLDPTGIVTLRLRPRLIAYSPRQGQAFSREALRRLAGLPGVRSASLGIVLPPWLQGDPVPVGFPGQKPIRPQDAFTAWSAQIAPHFFKTYGVSLLRGRDFDDHDTVGSPPVAIVNQTLARRLWPGGEAVGRRLAIEDKPYEVVGLVPDLGYRNSLEPPAPQVYDPYWQHDEYTDARLCIRADGDVSRLLPTLRRELHAIDPNVPVFEVEPMASSVNRFLSPVLVAGRILGFSAGLALFLSTLGLYGTLSLAVAQRTRDIGIRMAIGASRRQGMALILRDAAILMSVALVLGLAAALGASSLLAHFLYGVSPRDPLTYVAALGLLALTAALASWLPARRASQVDPLVALRQT